SAVVARADRPKVRYSITASLQPFRGLMCCDPTHNLIAAELCVRRHASCATEFSERVREFRVHPSNVPRVAEAQTLYWNAFRVNRWQSFVWCPGSLASKRCNATKLRLSTTSPLSGGLCCKSRQPKSVELEFEIIESGYTRFLNLCCVWERDLESILRAGVMKIASGHAAETAETT